MHVIGSYYEEDISTTRKEKNENTRLQAEEKDKRRKTGAKEQDQKRQI